MPKTLTDSGCGSDCRADTTIFHHPDPTINPMMFLVDYPLTEIGTENDTENDTENQSDIIHKLSLFLVNYTFAVCFVRICV